MRLISCYIENFGKLHQFSYDFKDGLNIICENNGWGKSTLAVFLKSMFYGMEKTGKRNLDENERKKYEPWNGGVYGGNVVFEAEGIVYRAERFFGGKDKDDTFVLYNVNTGLENHTYTENLGEELFGIDRIAFEQSVFMKQGMYTITMTDSVAAKMGGLMASGDDMDCYEKACERLETEMKIYKKTGNKGKIAELGDEIFELNRLISEAKQAGATLKDWEDKATLCKRETEELREQKDALKAQMRQAGEQAAIQEKYKHYQALLEEKEKLKAKVEELDSFFKNGLPEEGELEAYRNKLFSYNASVEPATERVSDFKYPVYADILSKHPMTEEELDACEQKWNAVRDKENLLEKKELGLQSLQIREEEKDAYLKEKAQSDKTKQKAAIVIAIVGLIAGIVLFFTVPEYYALIAGVVTIIAVVLAIVWGKKAKSSFDLAAEENEELIKMKEEYDTLSKSVESGKKAVRTYLQAFSIDGEDEIPFAVNRIRITLMEINAGKERSEALKAAEHKRMQEKEVLREELILFLRRFYADTSEVQEYLLTEISRKRSEYLHFSEQYTIKCKQFESVEPVESIPTESLLSMEQLQHQELLLEQDIQAKENHLRQLKDTIDMYSQRMEECEKWEMEKQELEEKLKEYKEKYALLDKTLKYLKTAQTEFSSRYLKKINEGYIKYAKLINEPKLCNSKMDVKLAVKSEESGAQRDVAYFSAGIREAMELCARFALVDALFEQETPFVVLDDPYANLDETAMEGARDVLNKIAENYQLIYFTCHSSRI